MALYKPGRDPEKFLDHRKRLTDAATGGRITQDTELIALHVPDEYNINDSLLLNLTCVVKAAERCKLILEGDTILPPAEVSDSYRVSVTFQELMGKHDSFWMAPAIRIECQCKWPTNTRNDDESKLVLEFHFNGLGKDLPGIQDFRVERDVLREGNIADEMAFTCHGAACEGFNWVKKYKARLGTHGMRLYDALFKLIKPQTPQKVRLRFFKPFREESSFVARLLRHLPSGEGPLLQSLKRPDWSMYLTNRADRGDIRSPRDLMDADVQHSMVPFGSRDTFATLSAASIQLRYPAHISHRERELALKLWAESKHLGIIYRVGAIAVMAVRFKSFERLGSATDEVKFHLPEGLYTEMSWYDSFKGRQWTCAGKLVPAPIRLPDNNGFFVITSLQAKTLKDMFLPPEREHSRWLDVTFKPHLNRFTYSSQMETAMRILAPSTARWHPFILNRLYVDLKPVDLAMYSTNGPGAALLATSTEGNFQRMLHSCNWNPEQLEALKIIRKALGGMALISGHAGTGKTLVEQAMGDFFYRSGLHILAVGPANCHCADFMRKLRKRYPDIIAIRIFPASTEIELKDVNEGRAKLHKPGHVDRASAGLVDADIELAELDSLEKYAEGRENSVQAQVFKLALQGNTRHLGYLRDGSGGRILPQKDLWAVLRECIEKSRAGKFDWTDPVAVRAYNQSYQACKGYLVAHRPFAVTTTGNVRCAELADFWAQGLYDTKCNGVVILLDEACRDKEIDTLVALLSKEFQSKIRGMAMLGDERQLEPTNTSAKSKMVFNAFPERESISLFSRLKRQGFPCVELKEQHRMNHHISKWPFQTFYNDSMRNAPEMYATLEQEDPGLRQCLLQFFRDHSGRSNIGADDGALRTHYLEIKGIRRKDAEDRSSVVREHIQIFFDTIFWYLLAYYGKEMAKQVMVIVAYSEARRLWKEASAFIQMEYKLSEGGAPSVSFVPEIVTIDSAQGREAPVVFLDCSVQQANRVGFVDDDNRMNVAFTRAKNIFWVLGGKCSRTLQAVPREGRESIGYEKLRDSIWGIWLDRLAGEEGSQSQDPIRRELCFVSTWHRNADTLKIKKKKIDEGSEWMRKHNKKKRINLTACYRNDVRKRKEEESSETQERRRIAE